MVFSVGGDGHGDVAMVKRIMAIMLMADANVYADADADDNGNDGNDDLAI